MRYQTSMIRSHPIQMSVAAFWWMILCSYLIGSVLCAQDKDVRLHFVSFPKVQNPEPVELLLKDGETIEVDLPTNSISEAYRVPLLSDWVLGEKGAGDGEVDFKVYGKTPSLGTGNQLILVMRKGEKNSEGLEMVAINYSDNAFGGGQYYLINASSVEIAGHVGTGKFTLKPSERTMLKPGPTKVNNDRKYAFTKFLYRKGNNVQPFFSSTWRFNENARSMVFFYHDPVSRHLRVHTIRNYMR